MSEKVEVEIMHLCPVVGIGASAGGLEALSELVKAIPAQSGFAYVIIQHLSPDHPSIMHDLLGSHSSIPVVQIGEQQAIEPDTIYVLPAGPYATIEGAELQLHDRETTYGMRAPIDRFLGSLAKARGSEAFAVILSGTGSDGTSGVREIKQAGGIAVVQQADSARFSGMPDSAAATGLVDFSLTPREIPSRLIEIYHHHHQTLSESESEDRRRDIEASLGDIVGTLKEEDGHDFTQYKPGTLIRRIERRMMLRRERDVPAFVSTLKHSAEERARLLQDILIGVTQFFRDKDVFEKLAANVIRPMLDRDQQRFRIWVPGCSTGEEAYTIAILVAEIMEERGDTRPWQIFGTDIDGAALMHARAALYSATQVEGVSREHRERFLLQLEDGFQLVPELRERCIFAPHNVLQDPPFSRLALISCRNLLIYLTSEVQKSLIPRFHYGLNEGGYLLLGPSETLGNQTRFFRPLDREARLFQRKDETPPAFSTLDAPRRGSRRRELRSLHPAQLSKPNKASLEPSFEQQLLSHFARQSAPPFASINANDEVSYLSERMSAYVKPVQGMPSAVLDQFLVRDLRVPARTAIRTVRQTGEPTVTRNIFVSEVGDPHIVDLEAVPLPFQSDTILITLQPVRTQDLDELTGAAESRGDAERDQIERELASTRQKLNAAQIGYEATEQELKSSNEELLSMNEEMQSTNEELETSREELQSINEELETVNAELAENNRQLLAANSDLQNLFDSTEIATVFLDENLCVRRFTPTSQRLFGFQDRDIGRSIADLQWKISYDELERDAAKVIETLQPIEREITIDKTEETLLMRIRPYRRIDNRIDGSVLTLVDITDQKHVEQKLQETANKLARQYAELESLYDATPVGLSLVDKDMRYVRINERLAEINGIPAVDHIGRSQSELLPDIDADIRHMQMQVLETGEASIGNPVTGTTPAQPGVERHWIADFYPVRDEASEVIALGSCVNEITEQKRLQLKLEQALNDLMQSEDRLSFALDTGKVGAWEYDLATEETDRTLLHDRIFGHDELLDEWDFEIFLGYVIEEDRAKVRLIFDEAAKTQSHYDLECRIRRADGQIRWIEAHSRPRFSPEGNLVGFAGTLADITTRKEAEQRQALLLDELQHRVKNTMATTLAIVRFSSKRASSVEEFTKTLSARLHAISRTHELLSGRRWEGANVRQIALEEVKPYIDSIDERFVFKGDDPVLSAKQSLALSLAFHELATNAAKYGALSIDEGQVAIMCEVTDDGMLALRWKEEKGPPVTEPSSQDTGFGTFLLRQVLGPDLEGSAEIEYAWDGVEWKAHIPLDI
ncbi:MAG: chemotaxis protein CheB [Pseudomonadota bacterium]